MLLRTLGDLTLEGTPLYRPKPLLLLAYLALEGPTSRRTLAELFFGDADDPRDSLSTTLTRLRKHVHEALILGPNLVSTAIACDAVQAIWHLEAGQIEEAVALYRGAFLQNLSLPLGEELEGWVCEKQDLLAQRLRTALLEEAEATSQRDASNRDKGQAARLAERAWRLTKDQGLDAETFARLYGLLLGGNSPYAAEIRQQASAYGIPFIMPAQKPEAETEGRARHEAGVRRPYARELLALLEALSEGEAGLAIGVWGPPGIGKSYTVRQALQGLPYPSVTLHAATPPARLPQRLPRPRDLPPWARGTLARLAQEQPTSLQDTTDALAALLAAQAPVVLHVEDLHEVEGEGLELWTSLAGAVRRSPGVGLIVASRQMPPEVFAAQRPPPLTPEESWELLEEAAGTALPAAAVAWIHEHAAGNPLFTLEFLRFLRRQGNLWSDGRRWRWRAPETLCIPANVETLISQTVRRAALDEDAKAFMWAKALLPADTPDALVAKVVTIDQAGLERVKGQLGRGGILHGDDFVHPLYREVQAAALSPQNRAHLAGRIVAALGPTHPESAAPFVGEAGLSGPAALDLFTRAAQTAAAQGRARQAGAWFVAAAGHSKGVRKRKLLLEAAHSLKDIRTAEAQGLAERVLEAEPDNVDAVLLLARCLVLQGEGERAEAVMQSLPERVRPSQRWFDELISLRTERSDYQGTVELWLSRPELQDAASTAAKRDAAYALMNLGRMEEAGALLVRTLALPELTDEARAGLLEVQASIALFLGNHHDSLRLLDEVIALLRAHDSRHSHQKLMYALRFRTMGYWGVCRLHEAVCDTEEAMRLASDLGSGRDYAIAQTYLGVSLTELGAYERAEEELLEARAVLVRSDAREHSAACEAMLSGLYLYWQPENAPAQVLKYAYRSLNLTRELGAPVLICQAATYAAMAENTFGSGERGLALAQESMDIAAQIGQRRVIGTSYWARGLAHERLGEHEHALRDLDEAECILRELGVVGLATYAGLEAARLRDDWDKAREHAQVLRELGVVGYTLLARRHFAALFEG